MEFMEFIVKNSVSVCGGMTIVNTRPPFTLSGVVFTKCTFTA